MIDSKSLMLNALWTKKEELSQLTRDAAELQDSYVKYFKEIKRLKSLQKAEAYLEPNRASTMELFLEYT